MAERLAVKSVYDALWQYARKRPDLGLGKAVLDAVLEPANPFDPKRGQSPKRWFLLVALWAALVFACLIYFNNPW